MLKKQLVSSIQKGVRCSFCGKGPEAVRRIVSGPRVCICDECVGLAARVIAADEAEEGWSE